MVPGIYSNSLDSGSMSRLIFHVGPHKTGTTYIQGLILEHKERLREHGIGYPEVYFFHFGQHFLINDLRRNVPVEDIRKTLLAEADSSDTLIFSSENYIALRKPALEKLKSVVQGHELRFVVYLRRPSVRLMSRWHEEVKHGVSESFESYFFTHMLKPMRSFEANVFNYVDLLISVFGRDSVRLVDYDTAAQNGRLMGDFQKAAGIEPLIEDTKSIVNPMSDLSEIEVIRSLNFMCAQEGVLKGSNAREKYYELKKQDAAFEATALKLIKGISGRVKNIELGAVGLDFAVFDKASQEYEDLLVNEPSKPANTPVSYPSTEWAFDRRLQKLQYVLFQKLLEVLK